ncbi:MAG TPA: biotin/lipoate A/B protein ligase family protein [Candidatus Manganitrophaceae bacterium]|nr:biotin/lipoate A/B protein ligase family protein [Candidatus Manganitrophaceae bacterium]
MALPSHLRTPWRLLIDPPLPPEINMAVDEAISIAYSEGAVPPTLRLYRWSLPSFSIGSFQELEPDWLDFLKTESIPLVRRMTGGRALLHDAELTYSVVSSTRDPLFSEGIKGTFYAIANGLLAGLRQIGIEAAVHTPPRGERAVRPRDPLCFASTSVYEITVRGRKLIGSAQRRWISHFLQHGSLIVGRSRVENPFTAENQIALADLLPEALPPGKLEKALRDGFEAALPVSLEPGLLTRKEAERAEALIKSKYGNDAWNLYRELPA